MRDSFHHVYRKTQQEVSSRLQSVQSRLKNVHGLSAGILMRLVTASPEVGRVSTEPSHGA